MIKGLAKLDVAPTMDLLRASAKYVDAGPS
jgi:hypothetical protein